MTKLRRAFEPSEEDRLRVRQGMAWGVSRPAICRAIINSDTGFPISLETLEKYFHFELEEGKEMVKADLCARLYTEAMKGNTYAGIFLLKSRHGFRDTDAPASMRGRTLNPDGSEANPVSGGMMILPADDDRATWEQRTIEAQAKLVSIEREADV